VTETIELALTASACDQAVVRHKPRYHENLNNVTPADAYFLRDKVIPRERERVKKRKIQHRRFRHQKQAAKSITQTNQSPRCSSRYDVQPYMAMDRETRFTHAP